jgi:hypothetical protein
MNLNLKGALCGALSLLFTVAAAAQGSYQVINVSNPGNIVGTVKWSGPQPHLAGMLINKDPAVCDPDSRKTRDLERLVIGPDGGVANTVVFLSDIAEGKAMDLPEQRRSLDQKQCRYEPHILLVPAGGPISIKSSDATLHTVHMDGAATYNLPFPFVNQTVSRVMQTPGMVNVRCNGGHAWMNAEVLVVSHPYYAVTDLQGKFELQDVPPGDYELVAWHEGWNLLRQEVSFDVLTERKVQRPVFSDPRIWKRKVKVDAGGNTLVNFVLSEK